MKMRQQIGRAGLIVLVAVAGCGSDRGAAPIGTINSDVFPGLDLWLFEGLVVDKPPPGSAAVRWEQVMVDPTGRELTVVYPGGDGERCTPPTGVTLQESGDLLTLTVYISTRRCGSVGEEKAVRILLDSSVDGHLLRNGACHDASGVCSPDGSEVDGDIDGSLLLAKGSISYLGWPPDLSS